MNMKFSSTQYFLLTAIILVCLTAIALLHTQYLDVLVGLLISALGIGAHISGVNTALPLQAPDAAPAQPTPPQSEKVGNG